MDSVERMYALYKATKYTVTANIPGSFVECGVWKGGASMVIALTLLKMGVNDRKLYLYDTFTGMPKPSKDDISSMTGLKAKNFWHDHWCDASLDEVKKDLAITKYPVKNIVFVKGLVEETLLKVIPSSIALLRLDTDWYKSTRVELVHLFPRLSKNGVLLIDDYGAWAGAKKAVDEYFEEIKNPILLNRIDYTGLIGVKI